VPSISYHNHQSKIGPSFKVTLNHGPPRPLDLERDLGVTISREIHEVKTVIYLEKVYELGSPRRRTRFRQARRDQQAVDQAGLADIGTPHERNLGDLARRKLLRRDCAFDKPGAGYLQTWQLKDQDYNRVPVVTITEVEVRGEGLFEPASITGWKQELRPPAALPRSAHLLEPRA